MKKFYLISLLMLFAYTANSQVNANLQTTESYLTFTVYNNYDRVEINYPFSTKTTNTVQGKYGEPEIPVIQKRYVLPLNAEQISVQVTNSNLQTIAGSYNLYPEQPPIPLDGGDPPEWVEPNPDIYQSNDPYPGKLVEIAHAEYTFGYLIVTVNIYPISYLPLSRTLKLYTDIFFQVNYTTFSGPVNRPQKISDYMNKLTKNYITNVVSNVDNIEVFLGGAEQVVQSSNGEKLILNPMPISGGNIPKFIIITSEEFSNPVPDKFDFTDFAEWKTKSGLPTVIVTLEQINQEYNGSDQAERIFYYLKDVYNN